MHTYSDFFSNSNSNEFVNTVKGRTIIIILNPKEENIIRITNMYGYSFFELQVNKTKCCVFYSDNFNNKFLTGYSKEKSFFDNNQTFGSFCHDTFGTKKVKVLRHCHITEHCGTSYSNLQGKYYTF